MTAVREIAASFRKQAAATGPILLMTPHPVIASHAPAWRGDLITGNGCGECEIATSLADSLLATTGLTRLPLVSALKGVSLS